MALPAFDAARRAAIDQYLLLAGPTAANPPSGGGRMMACTDRQTDGCPTTGWRRGVEVDARRARLVPGWVTVFGRVYHLGL